MTSKDVSELASALRELSAEFKGDARLGAALACATAADMLSKRVETPADHVSLEYKLPCDVRLPPATTIGKGCPLRTLMHAFRIREREPAEFVDERAMAVRRALSELHRPLENVTTVSNEHEHATYIESPEKASADCTCGELWRQTHKTAHLHGCPALTPAPDCTCPSGDGSLRWPCPVHPPTQVKTSAPPDDPHSDLPVELT